MKFMKLISLIIFLFLMTNTLSRDLGRSSSKLNSFLNNYKCLKITFSNVDKQNLKALYAYYDKSSKIVTFTSEPQSKKKFLAKGVFDESRFRIGWDQLWIKTHHVANPITQCWSAGYLEGFLTHKSIHLNYMNSQKLIYSDQKLLIKIKHFYRKIIKFLKIKINQTSMRVLSRKEFKKWSYISCILAQLEGITQGYNEQQQQNKLSIEDFFFLNTQGNIGDILNYIKYSDPKTEKKFKNDHKFYTKENLRKVYNTSKIDKIWEELVNHGHCSAIIKLIMNSNGEYDIYAGHTTWTDYCELLRTLKSYDFEFEGKKTNHMKNIKVSFSSYPGSIYSGDDFYLTSNKIAVIQSTISPINMFIYQNAINIEDYIPDFMRIMITNYKSKSAIEWVKNYKSFDSHLYSTQWVIIDYNKLEELNKNPKKNAPYGLVMLMEEAPGSIISLDISREFKRQTYFGSFNLPYLSVTREITGMNYFRSQNIFSDEYNPRYKILKYFEKKVTDLCSFVDLMTYNGYKLKSRKFKDDPSYYNPSHGISSRNDINHHYHGAVDYKVVDKNLVHEMMFIAKSGPTTSNPNLPPFDVSKVDNNMRKFMNGVPMLFNFSQIKFGEIN